jgi:hypothetical protein
MLKGRSLVLPAAGFIAALVFGVTSHAKSKGAPDYIFIDRDCSLLASFLGSKSVEESKPGDKSAMTCFRVRRKLECGVFDPNNKASFDGKAERSLVLNIKVDAQGKILAMSTSGNITYLVDLNQKSYVHGQSNNIEDKGQILKTCTGVALTWDEFKLTLEKSGGDH